MSVRLTECTAMLKTYISANISTVTDQSKGMEDLIRQAFLYVDIIEPHVAEGHYYLTGPDNKVIPPRVWASVVEPGWRINMHMLPFPESSKVDDASVKKLADIFTPFEEKEEKGQVQGEFREAGPHLTPPPSDRLIVDALIGASSALTSPQSAIERTLSSAFDIIERSLSNDKSQPNDIETTYEFAA
ncbi:hypothetical protein MMC27_004800 [Xylographa pallens]|nr:hypothetical protein [Xylographa pallens]